MSAFGAVVPGSSSCSQPLIASSYEQASYAIQDTAKTVADHYGRFLPQEKAAWAARVLDEVWKAH